MEIFLGKLIKNVSKASSDISYIKVTGLAFDSRRVKKGDAFFCKGKAFKTKYALEAAEKGAVCLVCEKSDGLLGVGVPVILTDDIYAEMARCAARFYGEPMKRLVTVAVTGTKGKSSVCAYINSALNSHLGYKSAILSELVPSDAVSLTTPESIDFQYAAHSALEMGCTHLVCEISSQGARERRIEGMHFDYGVFTNFGCDHIGKNEHASREEYLACKKTVLSACGELFLNIDCEEARDFAECFADKPVHTYSLFDKNADFYALNEKNGIIYVKTGGGESRLYCPDFGIHAAENALSAYAVSHTLGCREKEIALGISGTLLLGKGRLLHSADGKISVLVDYAHNEKSFISVFKSIERDYPKSEISVVFGCPGDKAECRRKGLSELVARNADHAFICEDDSGREGYEKISGELKNHFLSIFKQEKCRLLSTKLTFIRGRTEALEYAISLASERKGKQAVLMLGKGETTVNRGCGCDETCESDLEIAKRALSKYDKSIALKALFSREAVGRKTAVLLQSESEAKTLAEAAEALKENGLLRSISVLCTEDIARTLESESFKRGVAVYPYLLGGEEKGGFDGALAVFISKKEPFAEFLTLCRAEEDVNAVYITEKGGIIIGKRSLNGDIPLESAEVLAGNADSPALSAALDFLKCGCISVSFPEGGDKIGLISALLGENARGARIIGERANGF